MSVWCRKLKYIWFNGRIVGCEEARVHVLTHALHYGTGVFEGIRGYWNGSNLHVFRLRDHMVRLVNSAKLVGFNIGYTVEQLVDATIEVIRANGFREDVYIRPIAFIGEGGISLDITGMPVEIAIAAFPFGKYLKAEGVRVKVVSWRRVPSFSMPVMAKACGIYLNSVIALREARLEGCDEAILLDWRGYVAEGSGENVFIVRRGVIATPPTTASILEGITRDTVIRIARDEGYMVEERDITREELLTAEEVFFTGTAAEITPVLEVDGRPVGEGKPGPITMKLKEKYQRIVMGLEERYKHWLTPVY
ncbi:MAG: branched-chain amino acid transaminase [Acidilobaceae archaeon]